MSKILSKCLLGMFITLMLSGCGASAGFDEGAQRDYAAAVRQEAQNGATAISGAVEIAKAEQVQNAEVLRTTQAQNVQLQAQNSALAARASSAWVDGLTVGALGAGAICIVFLIALWWVMNQQVQAQAQYQIAPQVQPVYLQPSYEQMLEMVIRNVPADRAHIARAILGGVKQAQLPVAK